MFAIVNGRVFDGENFLDNKAVLIEGNKIVDIVDEPLLDSEIEKIDAEGNYITPGFIDLQLNGCGGVLFNDDISRRTLEVMNETNIKYGCTSFLPTLITSTDENIRRSLKLVDSIEDPEEVGVLGLHLEGPYISVEKRGVHREDLVRVLDNSVVSEIAEYGGDITKILTLAPENARPEHIRKLAESGINVALGHTNATYNEIEEKREFGITLATHLYNAMSPMGHREPGAVGAVLNGNYHAGIIVDGLHVAYPAVEIAKKIMGERLYLVTDAVAPAGTDMESFIFEGKKVFHRDGKCFDENGTLGGAALTMIEGVKNLVNHVNLPLEEAVRMATIYPAKAIGVGDRYGLIKKGYIADLAIIDKNLKISKMVVKGKVL